jgi:hypothetical protein
MLLGGAPPQSNMMDLHSKLVKGSNRENNSFVFLFGYLDWGLWLTRNDLIFNNIVASTPDVGVLLMISFMQKWSVLHKEKGQRWIGSVIYKLRLQLSSLNSED